MPYNKNLYDLFCSPNIIWEINSVVIRYLENISCVWKKGKPYNFLDGKPGGNKSLGNLRLGCHNDTETGFFTRGEMEDMDWVHVAPDRENRHCCLHGYQN
jgi:hypothetical protein